MGFQNHFEVGTQATLCTPVNIRQPPGITQRNLIIEELR